MQKWIIGIDEVGRGPLAGPVTVAACATTANFKDQISKFKYPLRDSKKLSEKQRNEWFVYIEEQSRKKKLYYAIASVSPKIIDKINITQAANRAATKAVERLIIKFQKSNIKYEILNFKNKIFLDGGLYLQGEYKGVGKTVIKGDEKIPAISLASIIAKVTRDRYMKKMHKQYPHYGFDAHKGYGTKAHLRAIKKYGISPLHRKSFLKHITE